MRKSVEMRRREEKIKGWTKVSAYKTNERDISPGEFSRMGLLTGARATGTK